MIPRRTFLALTALGFTTAVHAIPPHAPAPSVDQIVARVDRYYRSANRFDAEFEQISRNRLTPTEQRRHGNVRFERPMRFRMTYSVRRGDLVVCDGTNVWTYDAAAHAAVQSSLAQTQLPGVFAFLGTTPMTQRFTFRLLTVPNAPAHWVIEGRPLTPTDHMERVMLYVVQRSLEIASVVIVDVQGNSTRFDFHDVQTNTNAPVMFQWVTPLGARVTTMQTPNTSASSSPPPAAPPVRPHSP